MTLTKSLNQEDQKMTKLILRDKSAEISLVFWQTTYESYVFRTRPLRTKRPKPQVFTSPTINPRLLIKQQHWLTAFFQQVQLFISKNRNLQTRAPDGHFTGKQTRKQQSKQSNMRTHTVVVRAQPYVSTAHCRTNTGLFTLLYLIEVCG